MCCIIHIKDHKSSLFKVEITKMENIMNKSIVSLTNTVN